ncbi:MAG: hypothetical protein ACLUHE_09170 [Christensenellales bacterium]
MRRGPSSSYGSIGSLKSGTRVTVLLKGTAGVRSWAAA